MTKEEKALREWTEAMKMNGSQINLFYKEVRAMRRAIIEECCRTLEDGFDLSGTDTKGNKLLRDAIVAIRRMK